MSRPRSPAVVALATLAFAGVMAVTSHASVWSTPRGGQAGLLDLLAVVSAAFISVWGGWIYVVRQGGERPAMWRKAMPGVLVGAAVIGTSPSPRMTPRCRRWCRSRGRRCASYRRRRRDGLAEHHGLDVADPGAHALAVAALGSAMAITALTQLELLGAAAALLAAAGALLGLGLVVLPPGAKPPPAD